MKQKRILITGAAGFIGFHLAKHVHSRGDYVLGLDNYNDYYSPKFKRARTQELMKFGVTVMEGDVTDPLLLPHLLQKYEITHLVHLAAQAGIRYSVVNPQTYVSTNITGFLNVLEACRQKPNTILAYASSASVYGTNQKVPFSIDDRTDHQASFYAVTKKCNELMAYTYHHLYGIKVTGLRFFSVYGPWGRPDMAVYLFTKAICEGSPIDVYNEGNIYRDFTYIDDIIQGTAAAIDLEADCEVFNLGNHRPESILDLIKTIEDKLGKKAQKRLLPMQAGDVITTYADIEYSRQKLNFVPKTQMKAGISNFIDWFTSY